jgi:tetratricopeptide (TPR) repeat protein
MPHNRVAEAKAELYGALESNPLDRFTRAWLTCLVLIDAEYDKAIDEAERLLEIEPTSCWAHYFMGCAYRQMHWEAVNGHHRVTTSPSKTNLAEKAIREHLKAIELAPGSTFFHGWLGMAYGVAGREAEARAVLDQLRRSEGYTLPSAFGHAHLGLGEIDAALEWFDRAVEERDQIMMPILSYRHFDPLRDDPRFVALVRKMKLPVAASQ